MKQDKPPRTIEQIAGKLIIALNEVGIDAVGMNLNEMLHAYCVHCMPPAWKTAMETAEINCTRQTGMNPWKRRYG